MTVKCENNGYVSYRLNGLHSKLHRSDGPAVYYLSGQPSTWWLYGKQHRYYGPKGASGKWYIHGKFIK